MPSILDSFEQAEISHFPGADLLRDAEDRSNRYRPGALIARNVLFQVGRVETRTGHALFDTVGTLELTRFFNWLNGDFNRVLYFTVNGGAPKVVFVGYSPVLPLEDVITGINASAIDAIFTSFGSRVVMAFLTSAGAGVDTARIWNGLFTFTTPNVDQVFEPPLTETSQFTIGYSDTLAGDVTAGEHNVALSWITRNGYQTKAAVANASYTAPGNRNFVVTLTPVGNWPDWVDGVRVAMTTVQNQALYIFVAQVAVIGGTSSAAVAIIDLDDTAIAASVDVSEATEWFNILSRGDAGVPDKPKSIGDYSNRMVWIADILDTGSLTNVSVIYASEPGDPQRITAEFHALYLPGRKLATAQFWMGNTLYVLGPNWTYAFTDNTDKPATWAPPQQIDNTIGTLSPHGTSLNATRNIAWVASRDGLYPFDGAGYPNLPASYLQSPDWNRINWTIASKVQVVDDGIRDCVHVLVPLDGASEPSHWMSFDYKEGYAWYQVKYSLQDIASFNPAAMGLVLNPATKVYELMKSDSAATGIFLRPKSALAGDAEATLYNDNGVAIDSLYRAQPQPAVFNAPAFFRAVKLRIGGSGENAINVVNVNQDRVHALSPQALSATPEADVTRLFKVNSEGAAIEVNNNNTLNAFFHLTRLTMYWKQWLTKRR